MPLNVPLDVFPDTSDPFELNMSFRTQGTDFSGVQLYFLDRIQTPISGFSGRVYRVGTSIQNVQGTANFIDLTTGQDDMAVGGNINIKMWGYLQEDETCMFRFDLGYDSTTDIDVFTSGVFKGSNAPPYLGGLQLVPVDSAGVPVAGVEFEDGSLVIRTKISTSS